MFGFLFEAFQESLLFGSLVTLIVVCIAGLIFCGLGMAYCSFMIRYSNYKIQKQAKEERQAREQQIYCDIVTVYNELYIRDDYSEVDRDQLALIFFVKGLVEKATYGDDQTLLHCLDTIKPGTDLWTGVRNLFQKDLPNNPE